MKPSFALLLSQDGLVLCHRTSDGWLRVGEVLLTATDVAGELAALRTRALEIAKAQKLGPLITKLVLPNSEILYDRISVEGVTGPDYDAVIRERLDGRTPYAMDELCYDYVVTQGEAQVAVVARETLAEAEAFATEHGLEPVCFAAVPPKGAFSGEAMFGTTRLAPDLLAPTETLERDMAPVVILGETDWVGARAASQPPTESVAPPPEADAPVATAAPPEPAPEPSQDPDPMPPEPAVAAPAPVEAQPDLPAPSSVDEIPAPVAPAPPRARAEAAAKLAPPEAVVAAEKLAELAAPAKRSSRSLGLILTLALLAAMVLVGVVAAVLEQDDVVSTGAAPQAIDEAAPAPEPSPEQRAGATPTPAPDTAEDTTPPVIAEAALGPAEQPGVSAITAMTDGPPQPTAPAPVVSRFDALPTPEEVAEGEEATVPGTPTPAPAPAAAPTTAPVAVSDAPSSPALPTTAPPAQTSDAEPPVAARDLRPPLIETETRYAASGIWQRSPDPLQPIAPTVIGDLYVAALDRDVAIEDALALPAYMDSQDLRPVSPQPPVAPGQFFDLSADGFVTPTPEGALTPEGVLVFSEPGTRPSPRPQITPVTTTEDLRLAALASQRPPPRPKNVAELQERAELDGRSRAELAGLTPTPRPASIQELAAAETPEAVPANAMARSVYPDQRPSNFAQLVAAARAARVATAEPSTGQNRGVAAASTASFAAAAPAPQRETAPTIPTTASVARQATIEDALRLNRINLIGVYGTPNSRRALVRLASGRYVKVEVGDRVDGGRVGAIGETSLQYTKGGRNITLEMPRG
ncbi:hypothetical protein [Dinoroseobacter sp. S375]|uniref:hypothetical protein n=1 Tax=Dinoroseobacter sp. S375 TaxID=3415136 RepID=UPI003C7ECE05